jgi:hypothetical protein
MVAFIPTGEFSKMRRGLRLLHLDNDVRTPNYGGQQLTPSRMAIPSAARQGTAVSGFWNPGETAASKPQEVCAE